MIGDDVLTITGRQVADDRDQKALRAARRHWPEVSSKDLAAVGDRYIADRASGTLYVRYGALVDYTGAAETTESIRAFTRAEDGTLVFLQRPETGPATVASSRPSSRQPRRRSGRHASSTRSG